jgi:GNAT superfamily N-acetyltransferase
MALASIPSPTRRPPPLPVNLRLEAEPWERLPKQLLLSLRLNLTNSADRGDCKDDGVGAGSAFRELIDDYNMGIVPATGWWAITVWPEGSRYEGPIAWCLLRPRDNSVRSLVMGFYTHPTWRQRGIARLLNNEAARLAHQLGYKRLVASPWNERSVAFFRSVGYESIIKSGGGLHGYAELNITDERPARLPWRCRAPEHT